MSSFIRSVLAVLEHPLIFHKHHMLSSGYDTDQGGSDYCF